MSLEVTASRVQCPQNWTCLSPRLLVAVMIRLVRNLREAGQKKEEQKSDIADTDRDPDYYVVKSELQRLNL